MMKRLPRCNTPGLSCMSNSLTKLMESREAIILMGTFSGLGTSAFLYSNWEPLQAGQVACAMPQYNPSQEDEPANLICGVCLCWQLSELTQILRENARSHRTIAAERGLDARTSGKWRAISCTHLLYEAYAATQAVAASQNAEHPIPMVSACVNDVGSQETWRNASPIRARRLTVFSATSIAPTFLEWKQRCSAF